MAQSVPNTSPCGYGSRIFARDARSSGTTAEGGMGCVPYYEAEAVANPDYFLIFTPLVVNRCGLGSGRTGRRVTAALPVPGG